MDPRPYQTEAVDTILQRFEQRVTRPLLALPTGLGKTVVFALLAKRLDTKTLIIAHRDELLQQAAQKISLVWPGVEIGICKGERNEIDKQVVIASIQTAYRPNRLEQLKDQGFNLCIVDECHHAAADSYKTVLTRIGFMNNDPNRLLLGVTATVGRSDGKALNEVFQEIVFQMGIKAGVDQGYLSPLIGRLIFSKVDLRGVGTSAGDFNLSELANVLNTKSRNELIVDSFLKHAADRQRTVAFCCDIQHSKDLAASFLEKGISAAFVSGSMDEEERRQVLKDFSEGKYRVLCNCMILVEGYDESQIDCLLMARPTQSESLFVQMIGRSLRLHPGKQNSLILDFVDNSSRHSLCSIRNTLEGVVKVFDEEEEGEGQEIRVPGEKRGAEVVYDGEREINFFETREFCWTKTGNSWHLTISRDQEIWVNPVNEDLFEVLARDGEKTIQISEAPYPLLYACGLSEDWARKQDRWESARKDASWRSAPATQKQRSALEKFGFHYDPGISKGDAYTLLESRFKEPATDKQIAWIRARNLDIPRSITKLEASKLIGKNKR